MATAILQTRVDTETKKEAEALFNSLGLDITTAIRLFLKQAINQQKIPFDIVPPQEIFSSDSKTKSYSSARELFSDCE